MNEAQISIPKMQVQEIINLLKFLADTANDETTMLQARLMANSLNNRVSDAKKETR